jgi:hypothetical protein
MFELLRKRLPLGAAQALPERDEGFALGRNEKPDASPSRM